jgi:hypothetical protein|tara:strand:- start:29315 stop:29602 length:288 start_codon:yes stop_codon:yes gene_type:complete
MEKGFIIMLVVFVTIAIIHFLTLKIYNLSLSAKNNYRKKFFYFYGLYFFIYGVYLNIEKKIDVIGIGFVLLAIFILYLNYKGKIDSSLDEIIKKP